MSDSPPRLLAPGTRVRCRPQDPNRHNRAPRYVQDHVGEVLEIRGSYPLPGKVVARSGTEKPMVPVYSVCFAASELWGEGDHSVRVDLWESYLEPETNP
jgi:nitrile hydratase